jgi:parallel beta-helix repeat protein
LWFIVYGLLVHRSNFFCMRKLVFLLFILASTVLHAQQVELKAGMKITASITVRKSVYALNAVDGLQQPLIEISGNDIVVDFNNAILKGSNDKQLPNEFYGLAIWIKGGNNITIKNLNARGYKVAVMATDVEGLKIQNCNLSFNYRQRLNSTQEKEDISDWMSYHQNEKDEWLRYGAAMYLRNCSKSDIRNNIVTGGQCALMMTACNDNMVQDNNFSYNSAIGIGMYRSSNNRVLNNKLDFNVRGHSEGIYNRGQDSAAILVFEQCNRNMFAFNSATHSGDGFFLWAGQTTMDSGQGGCNDNILFKNDFSYAPTNGIEVTFSRNTILQNTMVGCDHGIWGGYSYSTKISNNRFANNRIAIAIEHGQEDTIQGNYFQGNRESIRLWARKTQPSDWGYAKHRDTRSRSHLVELNRFTGDSLVYNISHSSQVKLARNLEEDVKLVYKLDSFTLATLDTSEKMEGWERNLEALREPPGVYLPGRHNIRMTEWGPYDYRYPLVWRTNPLDTSGRLQFDLLGPAGRWRVIGSRGIQGLSKGAGSFPDSLSARKIPGHTGDVFLELEYIGSKIFGQMGDSLAAGRLSRFYFRDARVAMQWQVRWFRFDSVSNPVRDTNQVQKLQEGEPVLANRTRDLNYAWWGGVQVGNEKIIRFLTVAQSEVEVEPGQYELSVTWDDAVRVLVDGKMVINEWNPSLYKFDESPNRRVKLRLGGRHTLKVEHAELGGFATLSLKLVKI